MNLLEKLLLTIILLPLLGCGVKFDIAQRGLVDKSSMYKIESDKKEQDKPDVINPSDSTDIDNIKDNVENTAENNNGTIPLVQRQTITLKDGRQIIINQPDAHLDNEILQIRKTGDLIYKGLQPKENQITQAGLLRDRKNNKIFPVVVINHGNKTNNIPKGGQWLGRFFGEFQSKKNAYDVIGDAKAQVNLVQDRITGNVNNLRAQPADSNLGYQPLNGKITYNGQIQNGEWSGTATSQNLINPETNKVFTPNNSSTNGAFVTATQGAATEAAGQITLTNDTNEGLVGAIMMQHQP